MSDFHPPEVVGRGNETQLQVVELFNLAGWGGGVTVQILILTYLVKLPHAW